MGYTRWFVGRQVESVKGNILTVKEVIPKKDYVYIECNICHEKDPELWSKPLKVFKNVLIRGICGCGCFDKHRWDLDQYKILLNRLCAEKDLILVGVDWYESYLSKSQIYLYCSKHKKLSKTKIDSFLMNEHNPCKDCHLEVLGNSSRIHIGVIKKRFYEYKSSYTDVIRTEASNFKVFCEDCSKDVYAEAGLCDGWFNTTINSLNIGSIICRCSSNHRLPEKLLLHKIEQLCIDKNVTLVETHKKGESLVVRDKITIKCNTTGKKNKLRLDGFLYDERSCRCCNNTERPYGYIMYDKVKSFLKIGISSKATARCRQHQLNNPQYGLKVHAVYKFKDIQADAPESEIKKLFCQPSYHVKEDFPDGYSETTSYENINEIIEIFTKYGGERIL